MDISSVNKIAITQNTSSISSTKKEPIVPKDTVEINQQKEDASLNNIKHLRQKYLITYIKHYLPKRFLLSAPNLITWGAIGLATGCWLGITQALVGGAVGLATALLTHKINLKWQKDAQAEALSEALNIPKEKAKAQIEAQIAAATRNKILDEVSKKLLKDSTMYSYIQEKLKGTSYYEIFTSKTPQSFQIGLGVFLQGLSDNNKETINFLNTLSQSEKEAVNSILLTLKEG